MEGEPIKKVININESPEFDEYGAFINEITKRFEVEGLSEEVLAEIRNWYDRIHDEISGAGGDLEQLIKFELAKGEIYVITKQFRKARIALEEALQMIDFGQDENYVLEDKANGLLNSIPKPEPEQ